MRQFFKRCFVLAFLAVLGGCSADGGDTQTQTTVELQTGFTDDARRFAADAFVENMDKAGYEVREGFMYFFQIEDCQYLDSCYGNNPSSPYGIYAVPNLPDEFVDEDAPVIAAKKGDVNLGHRMRADEAFVLFGRTPPKAAYYGFTHYLVDRADALGKRKDLFASLSDTINPTNIRVSSDGTYDDAFNKDTVIVSTADQNMYTAIEGAMNSSGVSSDIMNLQVFPSSILNLGLEREADVVTFLFRIAIFENEDEETSYLSRPPFMLFRITPKVEREIEPLIASDRVDRRTGQTEANLAGSLDELERAIRQSHQGITLANSKTNPTSLYGEQCIEESTGCLGDNPDAAYLSNVPGRRLQEDDYFIIIGVNHMNAGRARYSNVSVYNLDKLMGVASFNSIEDMPGSADVYLPDHPDRDKLYAMTVRRSCAGHEYCMEVPTEFPGIPPNSFPMFVFRAYLEPGKTAGPHPGELLMPRVFKVDL